jgi:flagellar basal-body rod modification protein FlgD
MGVDAVATAAAGSGAAAIGTGREKELDKEDFLKLMVTQLTQQDPLNPQDGTEYVAQLAQFTSLERMMNIENGMNNMALATTSMNSTLAVDFIGKSVRSEGDTISLKAGGGPTEVGFHLGGDAENVEIMIKDADGNVVRTAEMNGVKGYNEFTWDGLDDDGKPLPPGEYTFSVGASDADGNILIAKTQSVHEVRSVSFKNGFPELILDNGDTVSLANVTEVLGSSSQTDNEE